MKKVYSGVLSENDTKWIIIFALILSLTHTHRITYHKVRGDFGSSSVWSIKIVGFNPVEQTGLYNWVRTWLR